MSQVETGYRLVDVGAGAKLEQFGNYLVCRPSPAATGRRDDAAPWNEADLMYQRRGEQGSWIGRAKEDAWTIDAGTIRLNLKPTPFGHLGMFPEQIDNWRWIHQLPIDLQGLEALNLFAYTGGTTLALARRGARVTHVDSAQPVVRWARRNAELNGLADAPIRWIVEDAMRYVTRELRRGRRYDIVVADPPAFGHGPRKRSWEFHRDLLELLDRLAELSERRPAVLLLTGHTQGLGHDQLAQAISRSFHRLNDKLIEHGAMTLRTDSGKELSVGYFARCFVKQ